ncbi:unnamed protein product [Urochloa decumbens]|uniref:Uncharacterized protein n=1 Tax=Urochloa decumbens TaxID=240449 RepID=A0ABC9ECJ7_9POAL
MDQYAAPTWAILISGFLMLFSVSLSMYLIFEHLSAYNNPEEQKFVLGVILMVPCYAIESYVSLVNPDTSVYCGILREGYEALAMYCFGRYITACLGGEERTIAFLKREGGEDTGEPLMHHASEKGVLHHHFPVNYILKPWRLGVRFYQIIKFGIFQYVIIKTLTASLSLILQPFGVYCDGEFKWGCGYPYFAVVLNFSQYWALYCLVEWYTATKDELAHINPLAKFLSFKSIVFLTWWQGVIIAIMYSLGLVRSPLAQSLELKSSIQDFIICIEVIKDFKFTVKQAVRPMGKRFDKMKKNIKFRQSRDDNWVSTSTPERTIRGIDDPLISGSASDSGISKGKRHRRDPSSAGAVDSWEGTEQAPDGFVIRGRRWEIRKP